MLCTLSEFWLCSVFALEFNCYKIEIVSSVPVSLRRNLYEEEPPCLPSMLDDMALQHLWQHGVDEGGLPNGDEGGPPPNGGGGGGGGADGDEPHEDDEAEEEEEEE